MYLSGYQEFILGRKDIFQEETGQLSSESIISPKLFNAAKAMLDSYNSYQCSIKSICGYLKVSEVQLHALFTDKLGIPPGAFIENLRLTDSLFLLGNINVPAYDVSVYCGYEHLRTYRNALKRRTGLTPDQCRKMIVNSQNPALQIDLMTEKIWNLINSLHQKALYKVLINWYMEKKNNFIILDKN